MEKSSSFGALWSEPWRDSRGICIPFYQIGNGGWSSVRENGVLIEALEIAWQF
jgi:hypothetical protein